MPKHTKAEKRANKKAGFKSAVGRMLSKKAPKVKANKPGY